MSDRCDDEAPKRGDRKWDMCKKVCGTCRWFAATSPKEHFGACTRSFFERRGRVLYERVWRDKAGCDVHDEPTDSLEQVAIDMFDEIVRHDERHPDEVPPDDDERSMYASRLSDLGVER